MSSSIGSMPCIAGAVLLQLIATAGAAQDVHWIIQAGGPGATTHIIAVEIDADNNALVAANINGSASFGGAALTGAGRGDFVVAKYDANGNHLWSFVYGGTDDDFVLGLAVAPGMVVVAGSFRSPTLSLGGTAHANAGSSDAFVAAFDDDGQYLWSRSAVGQNMDSASDVAIDAGGNVLVTGSFISASIDWGGEPVMSKGSTDVFLAKLTAAGSHVWSCGFGGPNLDNGFGVAVDAQSDVLVTGRFRVSADFGTGLLTSVDDGAEGFVAKYAGADHTPLWATSFGGPAHDVGNALVTDSSRNVIVTGGIYVNAVIGSDTLIANGAPDAFVAKYTAAGAPLWAHLFGGDSNEQGTALAVDDIHGRIVVGGSSYSDSIHFGPITVTNAGNLDAVLGQYGESGDVEWAAAYGGAGYEYVADVESISPDSWLVCGIFRGTATFGPIERTALGVEDGYLLRIGPTPTEASIAVDAVTAWLAPGVPNPMRSATTFRYGVSHPADVRLEIIDVRGRLVRRVLGGHLAPGPKSVTWDGLDDSGHQAAAGVYLVRFSGAGPVSTRMITLIH